ncbi:MAG: DUF2723 domain-containing protein [Bacteroidota bacterium]
MNYERINNYTGWGVFLFTLLVYLLTVAPTASFWDCGEFIACSYELEVTHPPGAPLFLLLGRIFSLFAFGDQTLVAFMINLMSVLASAFTALFTCWTTTILAKKGLSQTSLTERVRMVAIMGSGVVGGLTCAFADSIWFNAVEAEVYAMSSFFTAIVVWLMFKWEARADEPDHLRWIILIAYLMGLSIGVHLLNLLTIPALAMIYFFRKFDYSLKGFLATMGISVAILGIIQYGIIQQLFSIAWGFEKVFTGTVTRAGADQGGLGMGMGTGSMVLALLIVSVLVGLLWYSHQQRKVVLNTSILALTVIMLGFSSYALIFIRSNVDPPIDMNNPENIRTFLSYMKREQYGDRPLLKGPLYQAQVDRDSRGYPKTELEGMKYTLLEGVEKYVEDTEDVEYLYKDKDLVWFPRMYDPGRYNSGPFAYRTFVKNKGKDAKSPYDDRPSKAEDWRFFFEYQLNHMYIRYFLWNFVGRESDIQEANWESGLEIGTNSQLRHTYDKAHNKGKNHYYFLPLLLGMFGLVWQITSRRKDAAVIGMLFFFTGVAIIIYLNQYPLQPRERDYSYAGSFQTFAMWVGLGVAFLTEMLSRYLKDKSAWIAAGVAVLAPLLMLGQNWDDHSRKGRYVDIEFAKNLLDSCAPNAILFSGGDNDTFPLWYIQEVEGYRTDVRVVNLELLISDWYIDQMKQPKNQSDALPISMEHKNYAGEKGLVIYNYPSRTIRLPARKVDLLANGVITEEEASLLTGDEMSWEFKSRGSSRNAYILRKDSVMIDILRNVAEDGWQRPVYFGNTMPTSNFVGLKDYFRLEGMAYRVVPIKRSDRTPNDIYNGWIGQERMAHNLMERFRYAGLNDPSVNFDEHIRNVIVGNYRNAFLRLSNSYSDQIVAARENIRELQSMATAQVEKADSIQSEIKELETITLARQNKIRELMTFVRETIPLEAVAKPLALILTELQMLDRSGLNDLADIELQHAVERSLNDLEIYHKSGRQIDQHVMELRVCLIAIQYYAQNGMRDQAEALAEQIEQVANSDFGKRLLEGR